MRFLVALWMLAFAATAFAQSNPSPTLKSPVITNLLTLHAEAQAVTNVSTTSYSVTATDRFLCVTPTAATTITLLASPPTGLVLTINDCTGVFGTYPVTVQPSSGTIMGSTNVLMNKNRMSVDYEYTGSQWVIR